MEYFGFPCALMHLSAFEHAVEGKRTVLIHGGEGIEIQMSASNARGEPGRWNGCMGTCIDGMGYGSWF